MPIPVNQLDMSGLTSLAGRAAPSLNLPLHSVQSGGQEYADSLFKSAIIQQEYARQANVLANTGLQNQGAMNLQQLQNQGQIANTSLNNIFQGQRTNQELAQRQREAELTNKLGYAQLAETGQYHQGALGIAQQSANTAQQVAQNTQSFQQGQLNHLHENNMIVKMKNDYDAMREMKLDQIHQIGGVASTIVDAFYRVPEPEKRQQLINNILDYASSDVGGKVISKDQAEQFKKMTPEQQMMTSLYYGNIANAANTAYAPTRGGNDSGISMTIGSDGKVQSKMQLDPKNVAATQLEISNAGNFLDQIKNFEDNWQPKLQKLSTQGSGAFGYYSEKLGDIFHTKNSEENNKLLADARNAANTLILSFSTLMGKSAKFPVVSAALKDLKPTEKDDASDVVSKVQQIKQFANMVLQNDQRTITTGIDLGAPSLTSNPATGEQ